MPADPRALPFGAAVTTLVLASVLVTESPSLHAAQAGVLAGVVGYLTGIVPPALTATAAAVLAALLNAAFGFRLGCEMYLLIRRSTPAANMEVSQ
ncbi:DUF4395 family protein [Nonomuraea mesophila]|uniref:DUF4395 family protein n=1 Tax=Nonomuraea mesophila TaxID=2530382 RepID=A0A4R5E7F7_9ACTN|nr:DUF4395 family protein [Nonomuraea mesophila]TDE26809.1 DUF4395 family protein [Nonomuraea mesophila]